MGFSFPWIPAKDYEDEILPTRGRGERRSRPLQEGKEKDCGGRRGPPECGFRCGEGMASPTTKTRAWRKCIAFSAFPRAPSSPLLSSWARFRFLEMWMKGRAVNGRCSRLSSANNLQEFAKTVDPIIRSERRTFVGMAVAVTDPARSDFCIPRELDIRFRVADHQYSILIDAIELRYDVFVQYLRIWLFRNIWLISDNKTYDV